MQLLLPQHKLVLVVLVDSLLVPVLRTHELQGNSFLSQRHLSMLHKPRTLVCGHVVLVLSIPTNHNFRLQCCTPFQLPQCKLQFLQQYLGSLLLSFRKWQLPPLNKLEVEVDSLRAPVLRTDELLWNSCLSQRHL
jgi:hypothetical protein